MQSGGGKDDEDDHRCWQGCGRSVIGVADAPVEFRKNVDDMDRAAQAYLWEKL
jgi:hypothetical protein